jgi:ribosomal protein S18 acetylase RimI-like enzyme
MIKKLSMDQFFDAFSIIESVIEKMNNEQIFQWDEHYPTHEIIEKDIDNGHAFGFFHLDELRGYVVLNQEYSPEYDSLEWNDKSGTSLIVHRLSIKANCEGQGIAKQLMIFAEEYAKKNSYSSIKLDAFLHNKAALSLYENLGYTKVGTVTFRKGQFYCYEKVFLCSSI